MIKSKDEFNNKLCELMEEVENCNPEFSMDGMIFSDKAKNYIYELADYSRGLKLYRKTMGTKSWMCFECEYFAHDISCECTDITGKVPYEWVLPRVDYE